MVSASWLLLGLFSSLLYGSWAEDPAPETDAEDDPLALPRGLCPYDAVYYKNYCYEIFQYKTDWDNAEGQCQSLVDGHLASFQTLAEEKFVSSYIKRKSKVRIAWIGFHAESEVPGSELEWSWSDRSRYVPGYGLWDGRSPVATACGENCIALNSTDNPNAKERWQQYECNNSHFFVCKFKA
nr:PREDICTED: snaclec echicetin subunit beta [Anolis carolinensis]|eukprot:XP_008121059.1 PREDICTED: snaclec echicetin subunit beta [Anolis carolinensis]